MGNQQCRVWHSAGGLVTIGQSEASTDTHLTNEGAYQGILSRVSVCVGYMVKVRNWRWDKHVRGSQWEGVTGCLWPMRGLAMDMPWQVLTYLGCLFWKIKVAILQVWGFKPLRSSFSQLGVKTYFCKKLAYLHSRLHTAIQDVWKKKDKKKGKQCSSSTINL